MKVDENKLLLSTITRHLQYLTQVKKQLYQPSKGAQYEYPTALSSPDERSVITTILKKVLEWKLIGHNKLVSEISSLSPGIDLEKFIGNIVVNGYLLEMGHEDGFDDEKCYVVGPGGFTILCMCSICHKLVEEKGGVVLYNDREGVVCATCIGEKTWQSDVERCDFCGLPLSASKLTELLRPDIKQFDILVPLLNCEELDKYSDMTALGYVGFTKIAEEIVCYSGADVSWEKNELSKFISEIWDLDYPEYEIHRLDYSAELRGKRISELYITAVDRFKTLEADHKRRVQRWISNLFGPIGEIWSYSHSQSPVKCKDGKYYHPICYNRKFPDSLEHTTAEGEKAGNVAPLEKQQGQHS
nr:hypothetical protein [Candidatus Sigynarchaeota archaeon]